MIAMIPTASTTITTSGQQQLDAVIIRNLTHELGRGRNRKVILNGINLTVPEGSIYGLLGPSGCGKTTMLRCIVGRISPKSGSVLVFGLRPGGGLGEVPGRDVGYMPQDISIYEDFTIEETLRYFGKINRLDSGEISKRIEFLLKFLDLPTKKRLVANLSGGQKRRVSLAAALVHSPPLLILDEPTVGVDPLLRQNIWHHLVAMTRHEKISVIITTHYIEEARLANVVGLMRNGRLLAEASPDELMEQHQLSNLEEVFLKLCVSDSSSSSSGAAANRSRRSRKSGSSKENPTTRRGPKVNKQSIEQSTKRRPHSVSFNDQSAIRNATTKGRNQTRASANTRALNQLALGQMATHHQTAGVSPVDRQTKNVIDHSVNEPLGMVRARVEKKAAGSSVVALNQMKTIRIHTSTNRIELLGHDTDSSQAHEEAAYANEAVEVFSSEDEDEDEDRDSGASDEASLELGTMSEQEEEERLRRYQEESLFSQLSESSVELQDYLAVQQMNWAARRANSLSLARFQSSMRHKGPYGGLDGRDGRRLSSRSSYGSRRSRALAYQKRPFAAITNEASGGGGAANLLQWWSILIAVTWKNYIRLRRNPPVLVFQFMLPAIQVILFCLCIGGEPFDVPVAVVNEEQVPKSSVEFLAGLDRRIIRQVRYDNLSSAIEAVKRGRVWGALHIPDKYSENLHSRLILGDEATNETISNGTIRVYPDLTNLHLALALEKTFRETFLQFARDSIEEMGYDRSLADLPIKVGRPVYGTLRKGGYLEFMAPGVVISISYVMATGLTALAFILERRDGLLERSLVSGVQTSQILLAHAINQVFVMTIQIFLVLGCTFFIFEIPSRGPFFWVVLLILLQGCTGMAFGLLVSAICKEENTAVMMVVGTFYTNLILAGIIWPIEAMPHWLRPISYAQPQTLPTESLRHILSRGWGISELGVLTGFAVTIGWLGVFLLAAGVIFKYSR